MGGVVITVTVSGDFDFDLGGGGDGKNGRWRVQHQAGACMPCKMNEDTANVPCAECLGNLEIKAPRSGKGNLCKCTVVWDENG